MRNLCTAALFVLATACGRLPTLEEPDSAREDRQADPDSSPPADRDASEVAIGDTGASCLPACPTGQFCIGGTCFAPVADAGADVPADPGRPDTGVDAGRDAGPDVHCMYPEQTACGTACVFLLTDPLNCGGCDIRCDGFHHFCRRGECQYCATDDEIDCRPSGILCTNIAVDVENCGACGHYCGPGHHCIDRVCH